MKNIIFITLSLFMSSITITTAQTEFCGFESVHKKRLEEDSTYARIVGLTEKLIQERKNTKSAEDLLIIPVVVHVMHLGEPVGTGSNISEAQIQSAIDRLNVVYRGQHMPGAVDMKVEFRLAKQTIDCEPTNGIERFDVSDVPGYSQYGVNFENTTGVNDATFMNMAIWPVDKYFNIWIITEIDDNNGGAGIQGYAHFLTTTNMEGSFMIYKSFGYDPDNNHPEWDLSFSRNNKVPIHEFGHYFHLHHTFKGDDNGNSCPANVTVGVDSDGCDDTEPHIRNLGFCAAGTNNSCTGSTYNDNAAKNYMNYCTCPDRFTNDQKTRVRTTLTTIGISLVESEGDVEAPADLIKPIEINCGPVSQAQGLNNQNAGILNVKYADMDINSETTDRDNGYIDFSAKCVTYATVDRDSPDTLFVTTFTETPHVNVWIDVNNSGDFSDDELFFDGQAENYKVATEIVLPEETVLDTPLRMRIINDLQPIDAPCYSPKDGQGEDYTVFVTGLEIPEIPVGFPKSFSPNNDGLNDYFTVMGKHRIGQYNLKVFDKFGAMVYETDNKNNGWDGTFNGKKLNPDVFKYVSTISLLNGKQITLKGNITLER